MPASAALQAPILSSSESRSATKNRAGEFLVTRTVATDLLTGSISLSGTATRAYLSSHFASCAALLEPVDKLELLTRGDANSLKLMLRVKTAKPLKK